MATKTENTSTKTNATGGNTAVAPRTDAIAAPAGASVLIDEDGRTIVHNQVVAKIAGLAVQEIEGVRRLVPYGAGQTVSSLARTVTGNSMHEIGIHVEVGQKEAAVDVRIVSDYGASIPSIAEAIRRNVSERIETMTGLKIVEVNIDVVDLYFPESEEDVETRVAARVQ